MITKLAAEYTLLNAFDLSEDKSTVKIKITAQYNCKNDTDMQLTFNPVSKDLCSVSINDTALTPADSNNQQCRYNFVLLPQLNHIEAVFETDILARSYKDGFYSKYTPVYTVFTDFAQFRIPGTDNGFSATFKAMFSQKIPLFVKIFHGRPSIRFGSKAFDEERGILHHGKVKNTNGICSSSVTIATALPDLMAVNFALGKRFIN